MDVSIFSQTRQGYPQSWQSTRLFLQSSELGPPPTLSPTGECAPTPLVQGGAHSLAGEEVGCPSSDEGTDTGTLYMYFVGISLWPLNFSPVCLSVCLSTLYIPSVNCADIFEFPIWLPFNKCCLSVLSIFCVLPNYFFMNYTSWNCHDFDDILLDWQGLTILCGSSTVRLVSSGAYRYWPPSLRKYNDQRCHKGTFPAEKHTIAPESIDSNLSPQKSTQLPRNLLTWAYLRRKVHNCREIY